MDKQPENTNPKEKKEKKKWLRSRPLVAIIGFFVLLFLGAYLLHLFHGMWLIPVTIILAIAWAVFFSVDWDKDKDV